jgi:hypothetical protein
MNKMKSILGMVTVFTISMASAQVKTSDGEVIAGSPYTDDKYKDGIIYYGTDKNQTAPIRYNAYQDLIEYQQNGKALVLDANPGIKKVIVGGETFVPLPNSDSKKLRYFAVLDSGKMTLYSKKNIIFQPFKRGGKLDGSDQPAEFQKKPDTYYYQLGDGELKEIDNMKSLISSLPDKQDELNQYVKKEKISAKKEKDLLQFVKYYNSL